MAQTWAMVHFVFSWLVGFLQEFLAPINDKMTLVLFVLDFWRQVDAKNPQPQLLSLGLCQPPAGMALLAAGRCPDD